MVKKRKSCHGCKYLKITYNTQYPYACQYFGFKSKMIPYRHIKLESGTDCKAYTLRKPQK